MLTSRVAFTRFGDHLYFQPHRIRNESERQEDSLSISGHGAQALALEADNLVLKAARAFRRLVSHAPTGRFHLAKRIPYGAGLGGGTADACAALRLLARITGMDSASPLLQEAARAIGADGPATLHAKHLFMAGYGERIRLLAPLPRTYCLLVNPRVVLATGTVFATLAHQRAAQHTKVSSGYATSDSEVAAVGNFAALIAELNAKNNDLTPAAITLCPALGAGLAALAHHPACRLARMSGSGPSCFGLYQTRADARAAARAFKELFPSWWTTLGVLV